MSQSSTILPPAKVAVIGLGNMGQPMAACIARAGYQVVGFDLSADARAKFAAAGGKAASSVADAVSDAAVVITLLPDGKIVRAAIEGMKAHLARGTVVIDMSSSAPVGTKALGEELIEWGRAALGVTLNEFYGQTECNVVVSSCSALFEPRIGSIGKAVPGHRVQIVDDAGRVLPTGAEGNIGILAPDPVMFLGYWRNPEATREKFAGDYLVTGDVGVMDADGFIRFVGRNDDVITSAGYRIGPGPIEDCLLGHPAVRMAAVVGVPDATRTEIVKAFIVLNEGFAPGDALVREIQEHVRTRLAAHEYPRAIAFVDSLPMTATGKIVRRELRTLG